MVQKKQQNIKVKVKFVNFSNYLRELEEKDQRKINFYENLMKIKTNEERKEMTN